MLRNADGTPNGQDVFKEAVEQQGNTSHLFMARLECRLDTLVFRLGFAATIFGAQQLVSHGHIQVDGRKVDRRAFFVKPGMEIAIREKITQNQSCVRCDGSARSCRSKLSRTQ